MPASDASLAQIARAFLHEDAPVISLQVDSRGAILARNRFAAQVLGDDGPRTLSDVVVAPVDFVLEEHLAKGSAMLALLPVDRIPRTYHFRFFELDGGEVLALGKPDIEGLERMPQEVLRLNRALSASSRDLHQSNARLQRLNQLKNRFLGMAAHDLRNPLALLLMQAEVALDDAKTGRTVDIEETLTGICRGAERMRHLINSFLDYAVLEAGALELELAPVAVSELLDGALELVSLVAEKRGVRVACTIAEELPPLRGDGPKLEQVLSNVLGNAIEHSPEGATVTFTARATGRSIVLSVADSGPGIPPERIERLFEPFSGSGPKPAGGRGIGLGLAIAREIVSLHGGEIGVNVENGTTLEIRLPVETKPAGATIGIEELIREDSGPPAVDHPRAAASSGSASRRPRRIAGSRAADSATRAAIQSPPGSRARA